LDMISDAVDVANLSTRVSFSSEAPKLLGHFHSLEFGDAPATEPALLPPIWARGDLVNFSGPLGCGKSLLTGDIILGAVLSQREGIALGGQYSAS